VTEEQETVAGAIREHGNQMGTNLVFLKKFLEGQRQLQEDFLRAQSSASEKLQVRATRAAVWSAVAAIAAAVAAVVQVLRVGG
jgi:hypothetical protein